MKAVMFKGYTCIIRATKYVENDRLALQLRDYWDGEPVAIATLNLPEEHLEEGYVFIKDYSENEGMLKALRDAGIVGPPIAMAASGFVSVPLCQLLVTKEELVDAKWDPQI